MERQPGPCCMLAADRGNSHDLWLSLQSPFLADSLQNLGLLDCTDDLIVPAPKDKEVRICGFPAGSWLNFPSWSDDTHHLAFNVRTSVSDLANSFETVAGKATQALPC